jgi:hypothetical protein
MHSNTSIAKGILLSLGASHNVKSNTTFTRGGIHTHDKITICVDVPLKPILDILILRPGFKTSSPSALTVVWYTNYLHRAWGYRWHHLQPKDHEVTLFNCSCNKLLLPDNPTNATTLIDFSTSSPDISSRLIYYP